MSRYDIVIIGSNLGGLVCITSRSNGYNVAVLERMPRLEVVSRLFTRFKEIRYGYALYRQYGRRTDLTSPFHYFDLIKGCQGEPAGSQGL